jgi:hypothetical protein
MTTRSECFERVAQPPEAASLDTSAHIRPMSVAFDFQSHSRRRVERTIRECDSGGLGLLCPARRRGQVLPSIGLARRRGTLRPGSESRGLRSKPGLAWPPSHGRSFGPRKPRPRPRPVIAGPGPFPTHWHKPDSTGSTVDAALDLGVAAERTGDATTVSRHRRALVQGTAQTQTHAG